MNDNITWKDFKNLLFQDFNAPAGRLTENEDYYDEFSNMTMSGYDDTTEDTVDDNTPPSNLHTYHPWGIFFTIIGTVLLDFDADACQSPSRAYLLDVTLPGKTKDVR